MKRLTKKQMRIFAVGQLGWSILGGIISAWLVTFYLPTSGDIEAGAIQYLPAGIVAIGLTVLGIITAVSRVFDAVTDPLIASLSDRSKNPKGRRIPFMRFAAVPFAVVTVVLFCAPVHKISGWNIAWISVFIILFYLFMTMYCTPYNALISEFGKNQEDRMYISTAISLTFFAGTLLAYTPFVFAGVLRGMSVSYGWSYRICFIVLAVVALVCMLLPTFLLNEKEFVDSTPSNVHVLKSLTATFKNVEFRKFVISDIMYWIGLTLFQTGLPYFVKVSMCFEESWVMIFMGGMTVLSACLYPVITKLVKRHGKKKVVVAAFAGLALTYVVAAVSSIPGFILEQGPIGLAFGFGICILAALPMARLGIVPQSIVADIAEAEAKTTGENREGMFFAARTFAMKFGQSVAMLSFTSLAIIGTEQALNTNDITASKKGLMIVAIVAVVFCLLGALFLTFYNEKKIMGIIAKEGDEEFLKGVNKTRKSKAAVSETVEVTQEATTKEAPVEAE